MSKLKALIKLCWWPRNRVDHTFGCRACDIPHVMTPRQYVAHQREVHGRDWYLGSAL